MSVFFLFKQNRQKNSRFKTRWKWFIKKEHPRFSLFASVMEGKCCWICRQLSNVSKSSATKSLLHKLSWRGQGTDGRQGHSDNGEHALYAEQHRAGRRQTTRAWRIWSVAQSWVKVSPCGGTWQLQSPPYFMSALISTSGLAILPVIYSVHSDSQHQNRWRKIPS